MHRKFGHFGFVNRIIVFCVLLVWFSVFLAATMPVRVSAAANNPSPAGKVTFTFDDGYKSAITKAAPVLAEFGYKGTAYVVSNYAGNTKRTDYMRWNEVKQLQDQYGWEIGSHTKSHPLLTTISDNQKINQLRDSKAAFVANGINVTALASPYGDYNNKVLSTAARYYSSHRGFWDIGYNSWPNNDYLIRDQQVQAGVSIAQVKGYIDYARANNQWLVLTFHDIKDSPSSDPQDYEYATSQLREIAAYVKSQSMPVVNISESLVTSDANLLPNSSFNSGLSGGWTTDTPVNITLNSANNGSYPDSAKSIKLTGSTANTHLYSPKVSINPLTNYMIKSYLNVQSIKSGEVGFYIDEYGANGNWISGQFKKAEKTAFVQSMNFAYQPSSANVSSASLQVYTTANSGIVAYLDNVQWFSLSNKTPPPPPPAPSNLLTNGTFDNGLSPWSTDNTSAVTLDTLSHGAPANPVNSVRLQAAGNNSHLFSQLVTIESGKSYAVGGYLNLIQRSANSVGFYIDEYDASGNWISGQYKTDITSLGTHNVSLDYTPTSANVKKASLQVILSGNSSILAYFDDAKWIVL